MAGDHSSTEPVAADGSLTAGWLATLAISAALLGGSLWWRAQVLPEPVPGKIQGTNLPRTSKLVKQKIGSLEAYNQVIPQATQLGEFSHWTGERTVEPAAFDVMSRLMVGRIVPDLWREAQELVGDSNLVTYHAMTQVIHARWPQQLLPNAHVVLFPGHPRLRLVASEYRQDYFRDTGWHWRWIGQAIEQGNMPKAGELDIYAAEEFSEFLSVLAVGLLEWANRFEPADLGVPVDAAVMQRTVDLLFKFAKEEGATTQRGPALYSALTRDEVMNGVPQPMFREATKRLGLEFQHASDSALEKRRVELVVPTGVAGGGVSAGDFDGDGFADLYFAGAGGGQLCRNVGGKRMEDVSASAGLVRDGETRTGYFVDYDNDGDLDLFLTFVLRTNRLYRNEGGGKFTDVTEAAGIGGGNLVTHEAVWFDYDNDGLLDVYVANFGMWPNGDSPELSIQNRTAPPNQLYHHKIVEGRHVFEEVAKPMGVDDRGWTHCVGAWDFDQDGWLDLISLNDFGQSLAYRNIGGKQFKEETSTLHLDVVYNAMNFHLIDLEHTGHPALYITEISKLTHLVRYPKPVQGTMVKFAHLENMRALVVNKLLRRLPSGAFENVHDIHIEPSQMGWAWDASTFDYENDGDLDLLVLNGTEGMQNKSSSGAPGHNFLSRHAQQVNICFLSQDRYFYDVSAKCELAYKGNSRGSAWIDLDNDGDLDVAINDYHGPGRIFENVQATGNHWIRLQLQGTRSNRNAIGARVELRIGDEKRFGQVVSGKGFLSQNPLAIHFGLGPAKRADEVIVTWPGGIVQKLGPLTADKIHQLTEPTAGQ